MSDLEPIKIKVEPTKDLFVHILTRDIAHYAAITELVDNSVDGAKRVTTKAEDLSDFWINIDFDESHFCIDDNCGGIPLEIARDYAFRFGRAVGAVPIAGSIGQFGVGMKRALFSFGRYYVIESITESHWFRLEVDLDEWINWESWDFVLKDYGPNTEGRRVGTRIEVTKLTPDAARQFSLSSFRVRVENEIKQKHRFFVAQGLAIKVGGVTIPREEWQLYADDSFKPEYQKKVYSTEGASPVSVRIYAGVGRSSPSDAGWYVICNGRLILNGEKTEKTGWGWESADTDESDSPSEVPRYHNQYARFRGYVLFDSDDAGRLPWNTTKTDIDPDAPIWLDTRDIMAIMMRPVINFLNLVDNENHLPQNERGLSSALLAAMPQPIAGVQTTQKFSYPTLPKKIGPKMVSIQYRKEKSRVDDLQAAMGFSSARETGDAAFEDAYKRYVEEG